MIAKLRQHKTAVLSGLAAAGALTVFTIAALIPVVPGSPQTFATRQKGTTYVYNATTGTGTLSVTSTPVYMDLAGSIGFIQVTDPKAVSIEATISGSGTLVSGTVELTGSLDTNKNGSPDLQGVLLSGTLTRFGWQDGVATDLFDFEFEITGGALASMAGGGGSLGAVTLTAENSSFNGQFNRSFTSDAKLLVGPRPACTGSIGDFVWHDLNGNGVQDPGEPGINGAPVILTLPDGTTTLPTVTVNRPGALPLQAGYYEFAHLCAGTYTVTVDTSSPALAGYASTMPLQGDPDGNTANDSNPNPAVEITLESTFPGSSNQTIDFGFVNDCQAEIGDRVWVDLDGNGIQDPGEPGLDGVTVELLDANGTVLNTTVTASGGLYVFTGVCPNFYVVKFTAPPQYTFTRFQEGGDPEVDSDAGDDGTTPLFQVLHHAKDYSWDAGLVPPPAAIGDRVWRDTDGDGVQGDPVVEPGVAGLTVSLFQCEDQSQVGSSVVTDANGLYLFDNLLSGNYYVVFSGIDTTLYTGFTTPLALGSDPDLSVETDSNADQATGATLCVPLAPGERNLTIDAGLLPKAPQIQIEKSTNDRDADDPNGPDVPEIAPGASVAWSYYVTNSGTVPIARADIAVTDSHRGVVPVYVNGDDGDDVLGAGEVWLYRATGVALNLQLLPPSGVTVVADACRQGDASRPGRAAYTNVGTVTIPGVTDSDPSSYCNPAPASLGDFVWNDVNRNGLQDAGEPGIGGVLVTLLNCDGSPTGQTRTTDGNGGYLFEGLTPGCYRVQFATPAGFTPTLPNVGINDEIDSDAVGGTTGDYTLLSGEVNRTVDAGFHVIDACDVGLTMECALIPPPVTQNFTCSAAKPIDCLTMVWNGSNGITIKAWKGAVGGTLLTNVTVRRPDGTAKAPTDTIDNGDVVTVCGIGGSPNDQDWEIFAGTSQTTATRLGISRFHVSCSDPVMLGPEHCGLPQGDGKGTNAGLLNDWLLEGMAGTNGVSFSCTQLPAQLDWQSSCAISPAAAPSCETLTGKEKPNELVFTYTGGGCAAGANSQGSKYTCSSSGTVSGPVTVTAAGDSNFNKDVYTVSTTTLEPGAEVVVSWGGKALKSDSYIRLCDAAGVCEVIRFHTSCSVPVVVGEVFGSLTLDGLNGQRGGTDVAYRYIVTNGANGPIDFSLVDTVNGKVVYTRQGTLAATGSVAILDDFIARLNGETTSTATVTATMAGGLSCQATAEVTVAPPVVGGFCPAGPVNLGGIDLGDLASDLFFFSDARTDANWQSSSKGYVGNVGINGILAKERTSGSFAYAGTIYTNDSTLSAWQSIVTNNATQAFGALNEGAKVADREASLLAAMAQIDALPVTPGYESRSAASLSGINTQNGVAETIVINVTSGFGGISSKLTITGDAEDVFIMRWDSDLTRPGYQGQVKFQSGGAIVPQGGLTAGNFIHVAGDLNASGGGSTPVAPYPQGPRFDNGQGALVAGGSDFSGGGFFTGYWLTTGTPDKRETSSMSNAIFVGGWYSTTVKFSMTSGTSGVHVCPNPAAISPPPPPVVD